MDRKKKKERRVREKREKREKERIPHPTHQKSQELTDETPKKPTYNNIIQGIEWLTGGAKSGDSLFIHFSGHGGSYSTNTK